jgi:hypothetical protein
LVDGGVLVPQAFLASAAYLDSTRALHERTWAFYRELAEAGLLGELPASRYPVDSGVPVRGAVRLVSDYLLRTAEGFVAHFGDLVSGLVGMAVLCASSEPTGGRATPMNALAEQLQMPMETVRRHALGLVEAGKCERTRGGLVISEGSLETAPLSDIFRENAAHVQRLFAGLAERGVVEAWERLRPTAGAEGAVRA